MAGVDGGVCRELVTARVLRLLGVRARREVRGLSGGGRAHELGKKERKKAIRTRTKTRPARHVVHVLPTQRAGGLQAAGHETCEDATIMAIIRTVRERGERTCEQARGKTHSPPVNAITVSGWRSGAVARRV